MLKFNVIMSYYFIIFILILINLIIYKFQNNSIQLKYCLGNESVYFNICKLIKQDYQNNIFVIIRNPNMYDCGLFCYYNIYLSCIESFLIKGYIPIIDLKSFPNLLNGYIINSSSINPWEYFFEQPFCYNLNDVLDKAEKKIFFNCTKPCKAPLFVDYFNKSLSIIFWSNIAKNYIPIKKEIIKESKIIKNQLLKNSNNVLGVFIRGTDYLSVKKKGHPKVPSTEQVINDIKIMDRKYIYDMIFIVTEDKRIRNNIINEFGDKIKYLSPKKELNYNYTQKKLLFNYHNIVGNKDNLKNYILNMIILSKCIDIITSLTNGSVFVLIFKKGIFRHKKVYNLGFYK